MPAGANDPPKAKRSRVPTKFFQALPAAMRAAKQQKSASAGRAAGKSPQANGQKSAAEHPKSAAEVQEGEVQAREEDLEESEVIAGIEWYSQDCSLAQVCLGCRSASYLCQVPFAIT